MKNNYIKNIIITASITAFVFLFILFLIYTIYCYGIYDKSLENKMIKNYNNNKYDYIYDNMLQDDEYLTKDIYNKVIDLTLDYNNILKIYENYYKDKFTSEEFLDKFYYGNKHLSEDSFEFIKEGKTTLFKRSDIKYKKISLENTENKTTFGIIKNLKLIVNDNSLLYIDSKNVTCDNECDIEYLYGGIHSIKYIYDNYTYYGLINVKEDNQIIDINKLDTLVVLEKEGSISLTGQNKNTNTLVNGKYNLNECYLSSSCPSPKYSYIILNEDNTVEFYTYITLDMAGDTYYGTYTINNGFLILTFSSHTYRVHDYDTSSSTDITANTDIEFTFKILENNEFKNDKYSFKLEE